MKHLLYCLFLFITLLISSVAFGSTLKQDPKLITGKLSNGLTYYIYPNNYPKGEAVFRLFIKSGSVFENENQRGLAHFVEHMAFNGTKTFPGNALIRYLESKGAKFGKDLNAHTSFNETVYKLQLPTNDPGMVDTTMAILADWAGNITFDSTEIESERGVILSEWLSKTGPEQDAQNAFLMELLNKSRFSERIVIGDTAVIRHFPRQLICDYYQQWYHPQLMAVAVAGDVDVPRIKKLIREKFEPVKKIAHDDIPVYTIPDYDQEAATIVTHPSLQKIEYDRIQLLPERAPVVNEQTYRAYLQQLLLNRLMDARMNALSFENPPYAKASVGISGFLNTKGVLLASVELIPTKIDTGIQTFSTQLEQLYRFGFVPLEIEKAKKSYLNALQRSASTKKPTPSMDYMDQLYACFYKNDRLITPKEEYKLAKKYIGGIDSLTLVTYLHETVKPAQTHYMLTAFDKVASELPSKDKLLSMATDVRAKAIAPYTKNMTIPEKLLAKEPKAGKILKETAINQIQAQVLTLSNGATVIFRRSTAPNSPITLTAFRKGGLYALDSTDYVSGLYAGSIISLSGAGNFTRDALSHYLAGNTASVRFLIDKTRSGIAGTSNLADKETLFQLMYLKWTAPRLDSSVFRQGKEKAIESYRTANRTEEDRFNRDFSNLIQGTSYTTRELTDTILSAELQEESLLPAFNGSFGPASGYTFILTADCKLNELKPLILTYIGGLPAGAPDTAYVYKGPAIPVQPVVFERNAGNSPKAVVSLVFQNAGVDGDFRLFTLKEDMLQAVVRTKLLKELREKMGKVYSVSVSSGATLHPSALNRTTVAYTCKPEDAELLIEKTMEQIRQMVADPSSFEQELTDVKTNLIKDMRLESQQDSFWGGFIRNSLFNGETDWSWVSGFEQTVNAVSTGQIAGLMKANLLQTPMIRAIMYPKTN